MSGPQSNLDLLTAEIEIIWHPGGRADEAPPSVVIGDAGGGLVLRMRSDLPTGIQTAVEQILDTERLPQAARRIQDALQPDLGRVEVTVGPSYDCTAPAAQPTPATGRMLRSDRDRADAETLDIPKTWDDQEWPLLLAGELGPWAMIAERRRVLALCHSARVCDRGVEAGTWTADDVRGRGLAAAATAAWADICRSLPGHVFYSTDAYNLSSQRVAARLALPPIGQLWKFRRSGEGDGPPGAGLGPVRRIIP